MARKLLYAALAAGLVLGVAAAPSAALVPGGSSAPQGVLETNPIGTMSWLPVVANESPSGAGVFRLVVAYDHSIDPDTGEPTELIADGPWGMKLFSNSAADSDGNVPAITLVGHSPHTASLQDDGAPPELDRAFIGLSGDVNDGDCAALEDGDPSDLSYAYTTTFTLPGDVAPEPCQVVDGQEVDPETAEILSTTITEYVPGFWFDVKWPYETDKAGSGGPGHTLSEIWYGAMPGFSTSDPTTFTEATETGTGQTLRGPGDYIHRETLEDSEPNPTVLEACPGTGTTVEFTVPAAPEQADGINISLYPTGDWDLIVTDEFGNVETSGNFHLNESLNIPGASEGDVYDIEGCNFAGGPTAELVIGWL